MKQISLRIHLKYLAVLLTFLTVLIVTAGCEDQGEDPAGPADTTTSWNGDVWPALSGTCASCHSGASAQGGFDITDVNNWTSATTNSGGNPYVVSGDPDNSELVWRLEASNGYPQMPPGGGLPTATIDLVRDWIEQGLVVDKP